MRRTSRAERDMIDQKILHEWLRATSNPCGDPTRGNIGEITNATNTSCNGSNEIAKRFAVTVSVEVRNADPHTSIGKSNCSLCFRAITNPATVNGNSTMREMI